MARFIKYILGILGAIALLLVAAGIFITYFFDPNHYKPQISQYIQTQTGRQLTIDGDIKWKLFPYFGLQVNQIQLANPPGFPAEPFAQIEEADIKIKTMPLLHKRFEADSINLKGLKLNLIKNAKGDVNWQLLLQHAAETKAETPAQETTDKKSFNLQIADVKLTNANITWDDQQLNRQVMINNLNLRSKNIDLAQSFPVDLNFNFTNIAPALSGKVNLKTKANLHLVQQVYNLQDTDLNLQIDSKNLPQGKLTLNINSQISFDQNQQILNLNPLSININNGQTTINGFLTKNLANQLLNFQLNADQINLQNWQSTPPKPSAPEATTPMNPAPEPSAGNINFAAPLTFLRDLNMEGAVTINKLQLQKTALTDLTVKITAKDNSMLIGPVAAKLYQGNYQGQLNIDNKGKTPRFTLTQQFSKIQIGDFLADFAKENNYPVTGTGDLSMQINTSANDMENLKRNMDGTLRFAIKNGNVKNIDLDYEIQRIAAFINRQSEPKPKATSQTPFSNFSGSFNIHNGIADNRDLILEAPAAYVTGQGIVNVVTNMLDYRLNIKVQSDQLGRDAKKIQDYLGGSLPVKVTGLIAKPSVTPDWDVIGAAAGKALIKEQAKRLLSREMEKQLGQEAGEKLKKVLNLDKLL